MYIPRIVIAGTSSDSGKTTVSMGLMAALAQKGLQVQPFKAGPDYIDPMLHTFITGRPSRNLDNWMLDEKTVAYLFTRSASSADISVVEGVMGLYDGFGGKTTAGSTASLAKVIKSPVILVVNGEAVSLSIVPVIQGFQNFDRDLNIKGVILNHINSEDHYQMLKRYVTEYTGLAVLGYLPRRQAYELPSRHLGLVPGGEIGDLRSRVNCLAGQVTKTIDLKLLLDIARQAADFAGTDVHFNVPVEEPNRVKITVARDRAFNFYYQDNLELLEMMGAELEYFSPMQDGGVPEQTGGLYLGGGYPEVWAEELQANTAMRESIKSAVYHGLPVYAECGGLMYLTRHIIDSNGDKYEMAGVLPGWSEMTRGLKRFGYIEVEVTDNNIMSKKGDKIRAHEFHYSRTVLDDPVPVCFRVTKPREGQEPVVWHCGYKTANLLAGYPHLHFWGNPKFAGQFIKSCTNYFKLNSPRK